MPEKQFKSRYNHISKFSLASGIYFLSGGFSVVYVIQELHDSDAFKEGKDGLAALVALTLHEVGFGNPERLAYALMSYLSSEKDGEQKVALEKSLADLEKLRTQSVYVDFSDDLTLQGAPSKVSEQNVKKWLENARLGVGMLEFLRADYPDLKSLVSSMPESIREDVEKRSQEMIERMRNPEKGGENILESNGT